MSNNSKFSPGDMIGGYTLTAFCGVGGFGEVYLAKDKAERKFALKIALDAGKSKKEFDGLQKLSDCRNPHLIEIKHIDYHEGKLYYTMDRADNAGSEKEYVADTLALRISKGALPANEVYSIAEKIAEALACLHNHPDKLIHRDIKPDNIIFVKGEPVLIDVGLITTTKYEVSCGYTPGYVPDYISKGIKTPCRESDFYALGITLQCALTGMNNPAKAKDRYIDATISGEKESKLQNLLVKLDQDNFDDVTIHSAEDFLKCLHGNERKKESTAVKSKSSARSSTTKKDYRTLLEELYEQDIYTAPNIPEKKLKNALRSFAPGVKAEDVLLLADDTAFGSAKKGLILTKNALYGKEMWEKPKKISLFRNTTVSVKESKTLFINNYEFISLTLLKEKFPKLRAIIQAVCASHSDSFDGVCKPEILPKQKSGCLKKILIFAVCWILLGIIGTYWEEWGKKEKAVPEIKTPKPDSESTSAVLQRSGKQSSPKTERAIPLTSDKSGNITELKKLLEKYPLPSEIQQELEQIMAIKDKAVFGEKIAQKGNWFQNIYTLQANIKNMLLTISHTGKCTQEQMRSLEHLLKQRATYVEHYLKKNKTRVYLPGEKVDISAEVQKLLEQYKLPEKLQQELDVLYAMSNQAKTKKLRQSGRNYYLLYASDERVTNILQSIQLKGGDHTLLNALRSHLKFRKEYADALLKERSKPQQRSKQSAENMPEVRKLLGEYKLTVSETIKAESDPAVTNYNENIKMILDRITRKGNYSEKDLAQLRAFLYARKLHFAPPPSKHVQSILRGE